MEFHLPEQQLASIDRVEQNGAAVAAGQYTVDAAKGTVTFLKAPAKGVNNVEVWYTAKASLRTQVTSMRFAETYNGSTDTRVFLYGDAATRPSIPASPRTASRRRSIFRTSTKSPWTAATPPSPV